MEINMYLCVDNHVKSQFLFMIKKFFSPVSAVLVAAMLIASGVTACAQANQNSSESAKTEVVEKIVERYTGAVDTITIQSKYVSPEMKISVIHPHFETGKRYPVVYLLNGYGGNHTDWPKRQPRLTEIAHEKGIIFVCPDGRDSWYWDSPINKSLQMESFITKMLVGFIDQSYPTIADADHRAITGLSMGGHGALWLGMRHPDLFGSMGSMSGGVNILPFKTRWKMSKSLGTYNSNPELWKKSTVINLVPTLKPGQNITIDCGVKDFFAEVNADLHKKLLAAGIPHDYTERPGNHSWDYWRNSIIHHITFFEEAFRNADQKAAAAKNAAKSDVPAPKKK